MHLVNLDAYFRLASRGDKEALNVLYKQFKESARIEMLAAKKNSSNLAEIPEDFDDFIDNLFFAILNDYDPDRGSFTWYVSYILQKKFSPKVKKAVIDAQQQTLTKDLIEEELISFIDNIADPNQLKPSSELAISDFKYKIASPGRHLSKNEKLQQKIMLLQYAGFSNSEICTKLNLTKTMLRYQKSKIKEDDVMLNLKLDLK